MKTAELLETASGAAAATILPRGGIQSKYKVSNLAGVIRARYLLLGANTPWKRVRLTRGFGTRAANRAMKSSGSKMTWVVPSR